VLKLPVADFSLCQTLVGPANGMDPTGLKNGEVHTKGLGGNQRLWMAMMLSSCTWTLPDVIVFLSLAAVELTYLHLVRVVCILVSCLRNMSVQFYAV